MEGERDSTSGSFVKPAVVNGDEVFALATNADFHSYKAQTPYQHINHYKAVLSNSFIMGNSTLKTTLGWQQNRRKEYGDVLSPRTYMDYAFHEYF
ncbi:MAG: hypothetical protein U0Z17_06795 [Bacteroidales bacterium]